MESKTTYPEANNNFQMHDRPPSYNQSYPTVPNPYTAPSMKSSEAAPIITQPQQQPFQPMPHQTIVVQNQASMVQPAPQTSAAVLCRSCNQEQYPFSRVEAGLKTHLTAGILCLTGFCCFLAPIPYFVQCCLYTNRYCSKCNAFLM